MSFIASDKSAKFYQPGYFIARGDENVIRETREIKQSGAVTADNGAKYVPMGTIYPANDGTAEGIVYEDVDVTTGDMPGSVVLSGAVYTERLNGEISEDAKTALEGKGFVFIDTVPAVTRPY